MLCRTYCKSLGSVARVLCLLMAATALIISLGACAEPDGAAVTPAESAGPEPQSTSPPEATGLESATPGITPTSAAPAGPVQSSLAPQFYNAGTASVSKRIYDSDVVVRATLVSAAGGVLRFRAIEYLKGSGATEFTIRAPTDGRNTQWDGREAVLFLSIPESQGSSGASARTPATEFLFADATDQYYSGDLLEGYTIDTQNPVWLPSESNSGARSTSSDPGFITESESPVGDPLPTVPLSGLHSKIAWQGGGEGIDGYAECVRQSVLHEQYFRDWETYHDRPWPLHQSESRIESGVGKGAVISDYGRTVWEEYDRVWLTGPDADLFHAQIDDDDDLASNGYRKVITSARPLTGGNYQIVHNIQSYRFMPCNFIPVYHRLEWTVTVPSPSDAIHEAFFDPAADGAAVGFSGSSGVLKPAGFTVGGTSTSITGLKWENGAVVLTLDPYASLAGHALEFIELDGSASLTLSMSAAAADETAGTLTWTVADQPWEDGDQLMMRISVVPEVFLEDVDSPVIQGESDSFTLRATGLSSSSTYSIRLSTDNQHLGFGSGCSTVASTLPVPSGTSYSSTLTLTGCIVATGTVTATLLEGTTPG